MSNHVPHILVVDDERAIRDPLSQFLRKNGLRATTASSAEDARKQLELAKFNLIILDVMMPEEDGLSLCRWLVSNTQLPIILLTALSSETDRIVGLELGADDYVVKPFNPRELLARIRAVLRRLSDLPRLQNVTRQEFAGWVHDPGAREVAGPDGRQLRLTTTENRLLSTFLANPRKVLGRSYLTELVLGREEKPFDRAIDNHIGRLRKKLEIDPTDPRLIVTEWGGGYVLAAEVFEADGV